MNFLDDLRAEWIAMRKSLGEHIAYLEVGNKIHPIDQDPNEARWCTNKPMPLHF